MQLLVLNPRKGESMRLVIDVGNTNLTLGVVCEERGLLDTFRVASKMGNTADSLGVTLRQSLEFRGYSRADFSVAIAASVVPAMNRPLRLAVQRYFEVKLLWVGTDIPYGIKLDVDRPNEVGADRVVNSVMAWELFAKPTVVIDFGTATTFDVIDHRGAYIGGTIAPGPDVSFHALYQRAAKLPSVEPGPASAVIGKNTGDALRAGYYFGYLSLIDGVTDQIITELQAADVKVIATGGLSTLFVKESRHISEIVPSLTLEGLDLIWRKWKAVDETLGMEV